MQRLARAITNLSCSRYCSHYLNRSCLLIYRGRLSKFVKINVHEATVFWVKGHSVDAEIVNNGIHEVIMLGLCETPMYLMMDGGVAIDPLTVSQLQEAADEATGPEFSRRP